MCQLQNATTIVTKKKKKCMTFIQKNPNKREKNNIEIVKLVQKGKKKKKNSTKNKCITFVIMLSRD